MREILDVIREFGFPTTVAIYALVRLEFHVLAITKELRALNEAMLVHAAKQDDFDHPSRRRSDAPSTRR